MNIYEFFTLRRYGFAFVKENNILKLSQSKPLGLLSFKFTDVSFIFSIILKINTIFMYTFRYKQMFEIILCVAMSVPQAHDKTNNKHGSFAN